MRATWVLVAANVLVFALEALWGGSESSPTLYRMGANAGRAALTLEPWRTLSSAFLHIGLVHLLVNMWALVIFGRGLESLMGASRLMVLYALSALGGGLASSLARQETLSAGASGAVWGLMVAEIVLVLRPRVLLEGLAFEVKAWVVLQPLAVNLIFSLQPGIDLMGHLGGGLAGGAVMASGLLARRPASPAWRAAAAAGAISMIASLAVAFARGRPWELRAPVLEARSLPGGALTVPVPRGLPAAPAQGETIAFGSLRRDPIALECRTLRLERAVPPGAEREALLGLLPSFTGDSLRPGMRRESPAGIVLLPHGPALYDQIRYDNGARAEQWLMIEGATALRLLVVQRPDAPPAWRALPQQIAGGVAFR